MTKALPGNSELRASYATETDRLQQEFAATGDGRKAVIGRASLIETICHGLWKEKIAQEDSDSHGVALIALGGFGRGWLFPHSDVDVLFLYQDRERERHFKDQVRAFSQEVWDLHIRLSPQSRIVAECDRFEPENVEFIISLLDCRYLGGDRALFTRLRDKGIPRLISRHSQDVLQRLADLTHNRHGKHGSTIFHLEPNVKDTPGGLRDYNLAGWLAQISAMDKLQAWPEKEHLFPSSTRQQLDPAVEFLLAVRCFVHLRHGRDDNVLSWAAQDEAAARQIGATEKSNPADWMRIYFDHARRIHRIANQMLQEIPAGPSPLSRFKNTRSRLSNQDFSVVHGMIFLQQPDALRDTELLLRLFDFMAHHGLRLSMTTEARIVHVLPSLSATPPRGAELWRYLQVILLEPHAAEALREMHALKLLTILLPELKPIDSLVVRDFYHRFTVDEHSFLAIENLHRLQEAHSEWERHYAELFRELERPELLLLSLLLHDTGKGLRGPNHILGSLEISAQCLERLDLDREDAETVLFLVGNHLEISAVLRRDIFDASTVRALAEKIATPERLKMLTLLTYADVKSVNPEALTPWKSEQIWQVYIECANYLNRSADQRVHTDDESESLAQLRVMAPASAKNIKAFVEGFPKRYLRTYSAQNVVHHAELARRLGSSPVQLELERGRHWFELTLVTRDQPRLFASVSGVLAAWGMNIVKANAFSNQAGTVVDTFYFTDQFRTLELNLPEWERFQRNITEVLLGKADLARMLQDRVRPDKTAEVKVKVTTRIDFYNEWSPATTLMEVVAQDRPGLLHLISSQLADENCNIEIALIDTEGPVAIDVFYLTSSGAKLDAEEQHRVKRRILAALQR